MKKFILPLVALFFLDSNIFAATTHVDVNGFGDFTTIQQAIDNAQDHDVIIVSQGTYNENIDLNGKTITLTSTDPCDNNVVLSTIINGNNSGSCITINKTEGSETAIKGFLITNGAASQGGGINCSGTSPTISNCSFTSNTASNLGGGGVYCTSSGQAKLINCSFTNNQGADGGGM